MPADLSPDGCLHVEDSGIGLDEDGIRAVLATIGASTKRDALGLARESFLGQFGIGLLSCFLVTDEIRVTTRRAGTDATWLWVGRDDGTYSVAPSPEPRTEPGTDVALRPRGSAADLLSAEVVERLAATYAAHLPLDLVVETAAGPVSTAGRRFPWEGGGRDAALALGERVIGARPLDVVDLSDPVSGVRGQAFVLPHPTAARGGHRLYAKRMLVGESVPDVLPDWAFFVRAVLDTERLGLTASRESLQDDEVLEQTRARLGDQLKTWLLRMARTDRDRAEEFFRVHHLAVKAAATTDDDMLEVVAELLPWETTVGQMTLAQFTALDRVITYVDGVEAYQQVAAIARAEDIAVLNAGYAYDRTILQRWVSHTGGLEAVRLDPEHLADRFTEPTRDDELLFAPLLDVARSVLGRSRGRARRPVLPAEHDARRPPRGPRRPPRARPPRRRRHLGRRVGRRAGQHRAAGCRAALRPQRRAPGGAPTGAHDRRGPPAGGPRGPVRARPARRTASAHPLRQRTRGPGAAGADRPGRRRRTGMSQWDQVSEEFARVSLAADEAPVGTERVRAHEGALRLAQANGSFAEEFVARIDLTQALYYVPDDPHTLVHFAWLRRALEPQHALEQVDRDAVLWRLKWAIDLIESLPEVPLTSLVAAIDDVEEVYRAEGAALRPVHAARARLAHQTGDPDAVARELSAWVAEPRDTHSDCPACEYRGQSRLTAAARPEPGAGAARPRRRGGPHVRRGAPHQPRRRRRPAPVPRRRRRRGG